MRVRGVGMEGFSFNGTFSGVSFDVNFSDKFNIIKQDSGTGKTFMFGVIDAYCKKNGISCLLCNYSMLEFKDNFDEHIEGKSLVLLDNADLYLDSSLLSELESKDCIVVISIKSLVGLYVEDVGFYSVKYDEDSLTVVRV